MLKKITGKEFQRKIELKNQIFLNKKFWIINLINYDSNTMSCDSATCKIHPITSRAGQTIWSENYRLLLLFPQ